MDSFADHSAAALERLGSVAVDGVDLVIEQRVTDVDGDEVWHLQIAHGSITAVPGPAERADVTLRQDAATARALRAGELHAQHAFLTGRLVIDGNIAKLLEHGELLAGLTKGTNA